MPAAMEVLGCQSVVAVQLRHLGFRSLIPHGRAKILDECSCNSVVSNSTVRVSGGIGGCVRARGNEQSGEGKEGVLKVCVRCGVAYRDEDNSLVACKYHGHMTGDQGLYALSPPHQGVDGEWTDASGVIVYKWNDENERPSTGSKNWKRRWTCCGVYDEDAPPCHSGRHVSYDDGATRF